MGDMVDCMQVNGHELYVETHGPAGAPAVVLLHHGLGSVRAWQAQIPALAEAGFYTVAYDRWGYGRSGQREEFSIPFFNEDLDDLDDMLDQLGLERASLVGHSDGGTIALSYAARRPERVQSLVTVAAHIYVEPKMDTGIQRLRIGYENGSSFQQAFARVHGIKADMVFRAWYEGWRKPDSLHWDIRPLLRQIESPTLVIQGMEDEYATPQHAQDIAGAISGAELWLMEGARHMLPQEQAPEFNRRVIEFLQAHS